MLDSTFAFLESERGYVQHVPPHDKHRKLFNAAEAEVVALRTLPEIVCLCGSTRFKDAILKESAILTMRGKIVLAPNVFGREADDEDKEGLPEISSPEKGILDALHFRKIDLSSRIHVVNLDGYIGKSVHNEVKYAVKKGKLVTFSYPYVRPWDTRSKEPIRTAYYLKAIESTVSLEL